MQTDIAIEGFLSDEVANGVTATVRKKFAPWFDLIREVNRRAVSVQYEITIPSGQVQKMLVASLYARTLSDVQGAILLIERGLETQAQVLLRAALEALFNMVAIAKSEDVAKAFVAADELERKRVYGKVLQLSVPELRDEIAKAATAEKLAEIEKAIKDSGARKMSAEEMAKQADLHNLYLSAYTIFSSSVHSSVRDLEAHLVLTEDRDVEAIKNEPEIAALDRLLLTSVEILLIAVNALGATFALDVGAFHRTATARLGELHKTLGTN